MLEKIFKFEKGRKAMIGTQELILILIVALIVFGPQKLPEIGKTLGKAYAEFRKAQREIEDEILNESRVKKKVKDVESKKKV